MDKLFGVTKKVEFGWYILGSILILFGTFIGQIPFGIAAVVATMKKGNGMPPDTVALMKALDLNLSLFLLLLSFAVAFGVFYLVVRFIHKQTLTAITTSRAKVDWKRIFFSFGVWGLVTIATTVISFYSAESTMVWNFNGPKFALLVVIGLLMIPIQTSVEEYIFRGYLMQGFAQLYPRRWFPLFWTSLIFGLLHIANPEIEEMGYIVLLYYIGTGLFLGIMTLMDNGMELALGFHAANNLFTALLVTSDWSAFQTYALFKETDKPQVGFELFIPLLVFFPLLLFIFSKKYHWTDWKLRLMGPVTIPTTINTTTHESDVS
ncbi:MAG: hypothetical protein RLZZ500_406 [Bacteroidota bacterium]|jgi:membrane protease YdiL (CAAX protease family)